MPTNWYLFFVVALIPLVVGFIYYHKNVVGSAWMKINGFTEESIKAKNPNMAVTLIATYFFSVMLSTFLSSIVIHQQSISGLLVPEIQEAGSQAQLFYNDFISKYGDRHRTFSHGAAHGMIFSIFIALPLIAINALFEMRGWKYILLHFVYWLICLVLMGGVLCSTLVYPIL